MARESFGKGNPGGKRATLVVQKPGTKLYSHNTILYPMWLLRRV